MASINDREVLEGIQYQGEDESIAYTIKMGAIALALGSSPESVVVEVKDVDAGTTTTETNMPAGSPSINGNDITLPPLTALTAGRLYRVEVRYTIAGNVLENYALVQGQE